MAPLNQNDLTSFKPIIKINPRNTLLEFNTIGIIAPHPTREKIYQTLKMIKANQYCFLKGINNTLITLSPLDGYNLDITIELAFAATYYAVISQEVDEKVFWSRTKQGHFSEACKSVELPSTPSLKYDLFYYFISQIIITKSINSLESIYDKFTGTSTLFSHNTGNHIYQMWEEGIEACRRLIYSSSSPSPTVINEVRNLVQLLEGNYQKTQGIIQQIKDHEEQGKQIVDTAIADITDNQDDILIKYEVYKKSLEDIQKTITLLKNSCDYDTIYKIYNQIRMKTPPAPIN